MGLPSRLCPTQTLLNRQQSVRIDLTLEQTQAAFGAILAGEATPAQIGALLLGIQFNGITSDELTGVVRALRGAC